MNYDKVKIKKNSSVVQQSYQNKLHIQRFCRFQLHIFLQVYLLFI